MLIKFLFSKLSLGGRTAIAIFNQSSTFHTLAFLFFFSVISRNPEFRPFLAQLSLYPISHVSVFPFDWPFLPVHSNLKPISTKNTHLTSLEGETNYSRPTEVFCLVHPCLLFISLLFVLFASLHSSYSPTDGYFNEISLACSHLCEK